MADLPPQPEATPSLAWSNVWQVPVLLAGVLLLGAGLYLVMPREEAPDYRGVLASVEAYLEARNLDEAHQRLTLLHEAGISDPQTDEVVRARYAEARGDFQYLDYARLYPRPVDTSQSRKLLGKTVKAYRAADQLGRTIDDDSMRWWANALVLLGRNEAALKLVDRMSPDSSSRYQVLRELIERNRSRPNSDPAGLQRLVRRFEHELRRDRDAQRKLEERQWLIHLKAGIYLAVDDPQRAIDYINRETQRLRAAGASETPKLLVLLAKAYQQIEAFADARRLYALAQRRIGRGNALNGPILVGLAQIELAEGGQGHVDRAHALFSKAVTEHPLGRAYLDALIGRAHVEALRLQVAEALDHFQLAIVHALESTPAWDPRRQELVDKILTHVSGAMEGERVGDALDYLTLLNPMYRGGEQLPPPVLLKFARIHEKIGEQRRARADALDPKVWKGPGQPPTAARRQAYQESAYHFAQAAGYFRRHADTVTVVDAEGHGKSLWAAGQNFDKAQKWDEAIIVYAEYVSTRPSEGDQLRARFHLARAYMADRQYKPAVELFSGLIADHPQSNWAYRALVPLARCHSTLDQTDAALRTLLSVVDGHPSITPESDIYHDALIDLARIYYQMGRDDPVYFVSAIERLDTAVQRYGQSPEAPVLRYMLADSLRRSSAALADEADATHSKRQRLAFESERDKRLKDAEMYYDQVMTELEARYAAGRSDLEKLYLRNSYFFKADCAFARGAYKLAIDRYHAAARRWREHPASLVAQVQIVNAYCELGEFQEAYVANENALWQLAQMSDEVFESPAMPMTRRHWEDWLRWTSELKLLDEKSADASR